MPIKRYKQQLWLASSTVLMIKSQGHSSGLHSPQQFNVSIHELIAVSPERHGKCTWHQSDVLYTMPGHEVSMASDVLRTMPGPSGASPPGMLPRCSSPAVSKDNGSFAASADAAAAIGRAVLAWVN